MKLLVPKLLYPVAEEIYAEFFRGVVSGLVVEQSHQGQLYRVLRMFVDVPRGVRRSRGAGRSRSCRRRSWSGCAGWCARCRAAPVAEVEPAG